MSYSLDPDQAGIPFGPDLGPNCLKRLSELGIQIQGLRAIQMRQQKIWMLEHVFNNFSQCRASIYLRIFQGLQLLMDLEKKD